MVINDLTLDVFKIDPEIYRVNGILEKIEICLCHLGIKRFAVVKADVFSEIDFEGPFIDPFPPLSKQWFDPAFFGNYQGF